MKLLAVLSSGLGHLLPVMPSLWAARNAGASVVVAATGPAVEGAAKAGFPVVDLLPGSEEKFETLRMGFVRRMGGEPPRTRFALAMEMFAVTAELVVDPAYELARAWEPDLVVHTPLQPAGALVAAAAGVPAVEHGFQLTGVRRTQHLLIPHMREAQSRLGLSNVPEPAAALDVTPPSMATEGPQGTVLGYRPYGGGKVLPAGLFATENSGRTRVMITLGTDGTHDDLLPPLLDALSGRDLHLLVAGHLPHDLRTPDVVVSGWLPFDPLLRTCDVLIHHGGAGSTLTALALGVPQVIISEHADHAFNAAAVQRRGVGHTAIPQPGQGAHVIASAVESVVGDRAVKDTAREVAREIAGTPGPNDVIPQIVADLPRRQKELR